MESLSTFQMLEYGIGERGRRLHRPFYGAVFEANIVSCLTGRGAPVLRLLGRDILTKVHYNNHCFQGIYRAMFKV